MARESWSIKATPSECLEDLLNGIESIMEEWNFQIHKVDRERHFVEIFSFTKHANWLDVVEVQFQPGEQEGR